MQTRFPQSRSARIITKRSGRPAAGPLLFVLLFLLVLTGCRGNPTPDPRMIDLAVRSTLQAMPTPTPRVVEVTRVVETIRVVEVTRVVVPTATSTATPTAIPVPTPTTEPISAASIAGAPVAPARGLPAAPAGCQAAGPSEYMVMSVMGPRADYPAHRHPDLNLAVRSYVPVSAAAGLIDINGPTAGDPPQISSIVDGAAGRIRATYTVHDWDWSCGGSGCRGEPLSGVTMVGIGVQPGEAVRLPGRRADIGDGRAHALVLYADESRLTVGYTREDSVANGYALHLEGFCVAPALLARYREADAAGRTALPAVAAHSVLGAAGASPLMVAVRDRGTFLDPRSRKDWWQ